MQSLNTNKFKSKLTEDQVLEIYNSNKSVKILAAEYEVKKNTIYCIKNGRYWSSVTKANRGLLSYV